jgi:capsular polysaccharide biosynthesis protein
MNVSSRRDFYEPGDYLRALRRRWWIVLGLVILGGLAAGAYLKLAPKVYQATASVYVQATGVTANQVQGGRTSGAVNMDSEAQVVQSQTVATIAGHMLKSTVPASTLSKQITVTVPANSQVLQITCSQPTPGAAAACAQAFAQAYLQNRTTTSINQIRGTLTTLRSQIATLNHSAADLTAKIAALPPNSTARASAAAQLKSDDSQLSSLSNQVGLLTAQEANSSSGQIITPAVAPSSPSSPKVLLVVPSALAVGLLLGLILAFWMERRDKKIRTGKDLERRLDLPVLLTVASDRRGPEPSLALPRSRTGQAFADLAHLTSAALGDGNHVVVVTSAAEGLGASITAANLAAAFTRTHSQVVLVCADLDTSVVADLFRLGRARGLADVLAGTATVGEAMQRPADYPRLRVLTPGSDAARLGNDFQHDATHRLFTELRRSTPIVIIEVPTAGKDGDAFALAEFADAALVVVETGKTRWPDTEDCVQRLDRLRTMVLGAVLVPPSTVRDRARLTDGRPPPGARPAPPPVPQPAPDELSPMRTAPVTTPPERPQPSPAWEKPTPPPTWEKPADKGARG